MDLESSYNDKTTTLSSLLCLRLKQFAEIVAGLGICVVGLGALGLLIFVLSLPLLFLDELMTPSRSPTFNLEHASVSLTNVPNDQQIMNSEWFLRFSVDGAALDILAYEYINVYVAGLRNSTIAVIPPFRQNGGVTTHLNATVHAPLPRFNASGISLPFDVHMKARVKYTSKLFRFHMHANPGATCRGMKVDFDLVSAMKGTLSGGPYSCPNKHQEARAGITSP